MEQDIPLSCRLRVCLYGPLEVWKRDGASPWKLVGKDAWGKGRPARSVFKRLLVAPGRRLSRSSIQDDLWPESENFELADKTIYNAMNQIRQVTGKTLVKTYETIYEVADQSVIWVDRDACEALLKEAENRGYKSYQALPLLERALAYLERGELLEGESGTWVYGLRKKSEDLLRQCRLWLAESYEHQGRDLQAGLQYRALLQTVPPDEDALQRWIGMLHRQGKIQEALKCFQDVKELVEEHGMTLSPAIEQFVTSLVEQGQQGHIHILVDNGEEDMKRRDAIKTMGTTGASLVFGLASPLALSQDIGKEIDRLMTRKLARLQNWVVDGLEDGTQLRWQLYYTSRNSLTENGLLSQIARLEQLADDGGEQHQRVCRILAQNYQLAGSVARDRFQYTKALEFFQKAENLHEDIQLPDLTVTAIARQAIVLLRKDPERYLNQSLTLYNSALDAVKHAEPYTQAYVFSHNAEALARKGDYDGCIRSLDQAEALLNRVANIPIEEDFAYVHPSLQSLADSRGECYVLLGKAEKGLEHLQAAQKRLNQKMSRNNCRLLMLQSEAYLAASQPDACVQQALKGLEVARTLESTSNIHWADEILAKLRSSAFCNEPVVDELSEAIRA